MSTNQPRNMAASVRDRLLQRARREREEFQNTLTRYGVERLLYRLGRSAHRQRFVLKGANAFVLWMGAAHRQTRDLDFLGHGGHNVEEVTNAFQAICREPVSDDGLIFDTESVTGAAIRESAKYSGVRITMRALLGQAIIPLQIDVGFGDVITPAALQAEWPTLLGFPSPSVFTYPPETVVAEKCEAMVYLGLENTRLKDFFDLWHLATRLDFEGTILCQAIAATFQRRDTAVPALPPPAFTAAFFEDPNRQRQWSTFWRRSGLPAGEAISLAECCELLHVFLAPLLEAIREHTSLDLIWRHEGRAWQRLTEASQAVSPAQPSTSA